MFAKEVGVVRRRKGRRFLHRGCRGGRCMMIVIGGFRGFMGRIRVDCSAAQYTVYCAALQTTLKIEVYNTFLSIGEKLWPLSFTTCTSLRTRASLVLVEFRNAHVVDRFVVENNAVADAPPNVVPGDSRPRSQL